MNIAILIGVSTYKSQATLPACAFDVENMRRLLAATKKYDDIQCIKDGTNASQVKDALRSFFAKHQNSSDISETLIYFSGHGVYQNDALLCCSDFDANRPATTSVSNSELDDLLRSVKPDVAVKIIDACQSGSPYIKDASAGFEKALGTSQLNSFICMASSQQDQSSYATSNESAFTAKWIDAALSKQGGTILYRDIQAALADAFVTDADQTPFFVNQGTGLEVFSTVTGDMRNLLASRSKLVEPEKPNDAIAQLIESEVSKRDVQFVSHDSAIAAIEQSKISLIEQPGGDTLVAKFYTKSVSTDFKLAAIPKSREVAEFAEKQAWLKSYFIKINNEPYKIRTNRDQLSFYSRPRITTGGGFSNSSGGFSNLKREPSDYVYETRMRPSSIESTELLPFEVAEVSFASEHPSLPGFLIYIGIVHSLTDVMILSSTVVLSQKGWSEKTPKLSGVQWRYQNYTWTAIAKDPAILWRDALMRGESDIRGYLESLISKAEALPDSVDISASNTDENKPAI